MKKIVLLLLILIVIVLVFVYKGNSDPSAVISRFAQDEKLLSGNLKYRAYLFGLFPVGEATFEAEKRGELAGREVLHLRAEAKSMPFISKIFSASALLDSYLDTKDLNPILFKQALVVNGKPDEKNEALYDQAEHIMTIEGVRRQILPDTQDPLSVMFKLRRLGMREPGSFEMNLNTNQKNYTLTGSLSEKELAVGNETYQLLILRADIKRRDKSPRHKTKIDAILLKGKLNTPLIIKIVAAGIPINARLFEID